MKIEKIKYQSYKLLKFKLISSKILKKEHYLKNITLEDVEFRLKKALHIIYLYHISNKQILFVGNPLHINNELKNLLFSTKHIFIPKSAWIEGIITNQNFSIKSLIKQKKNNINKISERLLQLKKKSDLVVIIDPVSDFKAIDESYITKIPVIALNSNLKAFDTKTSYKIPGNFIISKNKYKNNFFYSILISTLKKSNKVKNRFPKLSYQLNSIALIKKLNKKSYSNKKNSYDFSKKK